MNRVWTTLLRELNGYFFNPVGYLIAVLLYLYRGIEISSVVARVHRAGSDVEEFAAAYVLQQSSLIMIVLVPPILTMRCFAEERRTGSLEVLMTAPVRNWEVVLGKWAAAFVFFCVLWLPTLGVLWLLAGDSFLAADLAFSPVVSGYLGLVLVGAFVLSAGCFTSSLTDNVLLASLSGILIGWGLISLPGFVTPYVDSIATDWPLVDQLLAQVNVVAQLSQWFSRGLIDTGHCVFYVAGTAFFLFLTAQSLEARRWK